MSISPSELAPEVVIRGGKAWAGWPLGVLLGLLIVAHLSAFCAMYYKSEKNQANMYDRIEAQNAAITAHLFDMAKDVARARSQATKANAAAREAKDAANAARDLIGQSVDTQRDTNARFDREIQSIRERTGKRAPVIPSEGKPVSVYLGAFRGPGLA